MFSHKPHSTAVGLPIFNNQNREFFTGTFQGNDTQIREAFHIFTNLRHMYRSTYMPNRPPKSNQINIKALPKTIGIRNDLRTVVLWRCLLFILAIRLNRTLSNQAMIMPLLCLTMSARAKLVCRRRLGCFLSTPFICFATLSDIARKKTIKYTTMAYLWKALFLAGFGSQ